MPRISVQLQSSALSLATYDLDSQTLDVRFVNGRTYTHEGVPENIFEGLCDARSAGSFYAQQIKGRY